MTRRSELERQQCDAKQEAIRINLLQVAPSNNIVRILFVLLLKKRNIDLRWSKKRQSIRTVHIKKSDIQHSTTAHLSLNRIYNKKKLK